MLYFVKGAQAQTFAPPRLSLPTCRHCGGELKDYGGHKNAFHPSGRSVSDVWIDIPPVRGKKHRSANELSVKLLDRVLDIGARPGDIVLDPFGGTGTTFVVAELKGMKWLGCELGDCSPIVERLKHIDADKVIWQKHRREVNVLFTEQTLKLRSEHGFNNEKYRS